MRSITLDDLHPIAPNTWQIPRSVRNDMRVNARARRPLRWPCLLARPFATRCSTRASITSRTAAESARTQRGRFTSDKLPVEPGGAASLDLRVDGIRHDPVPPDTVTVCVKQAALPRAALISVPFARQRTERGACIYTAIGAVRDQVDAKFPFGRFHGGINLAGGTRCPSVLELEMFDEGASIVFIIWARRGGAIL